ncbi:hypothetical protein CIB93_09635 [Streptomyces sp. WZ.A104]|uniref:hypothetical protein n=1 Tax=Streptomyces sp. WZ.A104 TaxID=2023771 RepID=UPI000BBC8667|nr:hypothetical protein [Streptomyces sp. WZ.A104]PCG86223.1 hypothetical protein CIB93_09635 [Streptomyces sp. WZ.A104]
MLCPAAGTHPTVACPVKRRSLGRDPRLPLIDVTPAPAGHPEVCRRESLTFTRDIGIRHWQELDHGLAPWVHHYFWLRNRVEHFNGYAKDHEAVERSRTRRIRGIAARRRPSNRHKLKNPRDWTPGGYLPGTTPEN